LTKNALKFTHKGLITIRTAYDYEQEMLQVSVIDTGKGIKLEEMAKLFTLFGKVDRTEDSNPDGLGMGLTICQKIIENSGG
jgi:signal transduction histidine kinase